MSEYENILSHIEKLSLPKLGNLTEDLKKIVKKKASKDDSFFQGQIIFRHVGLNKWNMGFEGYTAHEVRKVSPVTLMVSNTYLRCYTSSLHSTHAGEDVWMSGVNRSRFKKIDVVTEIDNTIEPTFVTRWGHKKHKDTPIPTDIIEQAIKRVTDCSTHLMSDNFKSMVINELEEMK